MNDITPGAPPTPADNLHAELRSLIASSRQRLAGAVNAELTRLYWTVGQRLRTEVLGDARASYGTQLLDQLGQQLTNEFGRGFESRNLRRMVKFAEAFSDAAIVSTLSAKLSWSHMVAIVALKTPVAREFYAQQAAQDGWSVRELHHQIERKAFERTELASLQVTPAHAESVVTLGSSPAQVFKDPYFLDLLGLRQGHDEADLEAAILRQLEAFILELGRGFAFVERQKRMVIDGEDFYVGALCTAPASLRQSDRDGPQGVFLSPIVPLLARKTTRQTARARLFAGRRESCRGSPNLLSYHRRLRRLVAIELKLGRFKAAQKGQMELYLKWLDKHERQAGEEAPIGLILCAESSREQGAAANEQRRHHRRRILDRAATQAALEQHLHQAVTEAQVRLARRGLLVDGGDDE